MPTTSSDERLLYGREAEVRRVVETCAAGRVAVVSAAPCMGVSFLFEAGVIPALRRDDCIVLVFRAWQGRFFVNGLREKVAEAVREFSGMDFSVDGDELEDILHRGIKLTGKRITLVLDQFEDYLRCHSGTDVADLFDAELARASRLEGAAPVIFGLQNHALATFARLQQLIPNLLGNHVQLEPLRKEDVSQWVEGAARRRRLEPEPGVTGVLLSSPAAAAGSGIHPFLFAAGLQRLLDAETRRNSGTVSLSAIQGLGGPDKLILESLDATLAELSSTHRELFFRLCNILLAADGRRQAVTGQIIADYSGRLNRFVLTLLPLLIGKNILRAVEVRDAVWYEIARDGMAPIIRAWWENKEAVDVARQRAAFRVRSIALAAGTIALSYVAWLVLTWKG